MKLPPYDPTSGFLALALQRRAFLRASSTLAVGWALGGLQPGETESQTPASPATPVPQETVDQPTEPEPEPEPDPIPTEFRRGDHGEGVADLQSRLNASGYWCGAVDGGFGHLTQQAVWAVQKAHGLSRDGIAGPLTVAAVESGYRPAPYSGGDHVEVHLASQLILLVRGGATTMVLNTSTGNGEPYEFEGGSYLAHTPTGDYAVWYVDGSGWRDGELGELYRPMFYSGNFAIHGSGSIPPWPASHGCARISTQAMDMFWSQNLLKMGDRVIVI